MPFLDDVDSREVLQEWQPPWTTIACSSSCSARIAANDIREPPLPVFLSPVLWNYGHVCLQIGWRNENPEAVAQMITLW